MAADHWNRWHIVQLTPDAALAHERRIRNCSPDVMLGWTPYTYRATRGAVAQWACHDKEECARRLVQYGLVIDGWSEWRDGIRSSSMSEVS